MPSVFNLYVWLQDGCPSDVWLQLLERCASESGGQPIVMRNLAKQMADHNAQLRQGVSDQQQQLSAQKQQMLTQQQLITAQQQHVAVLQEQMLAQQQEAAQQSVLIAGLQEQLQQVLQR